MAEKLKAFLKTKIKRLSDDLYTKILGYCVHKSVNPNQILLRPNQIAREIYFVEKGCVRTFYITESGTEITVAFYFEGTFNIVNPSFFTQKVFDFYIEAVEKSELLAINYRGFKFLERIVPDFHSLGLIKLYNDDSRLQSGLMEMRALEAYAWLLKNRPEFIHRLSNELIASYLGITTRTLSRVRQQIKKICLEDYEVEVFISKFIVLDLRSIIK